MKKCNMDFADKCQKDVYTDNRCILHCKKNDYSKDWHSGLLSDFYNEFIEYTLDELFEYKYSQIDQFSKEDLRTYFKNKKFDNKSYNEALKKTIFIPSFIHFPTRDGRDTFDFLKILNLFGQIHFNYCEFYLSSLDLDNVECFFQDCKFHDRWTLYNYKILENEDNVIYQTCIFNKSVSNYLPETSNGPIVYTHSQFDYTCIFKENLKFDRAVFKNRLFNTEQYNFPDNNIIKILEFNKCTFEKEFKLNHYTIDEFIVESSVFKDTFEFQGNSVDNVNIEKSKFEKVSDFKDSKFINLYISDSIFHENIDFKGSTFGIKDKLTKTPTTLKSVIIDKAINFRNVKFYYGLDMPDTSIHDLSNFLDADLDIKYTPRDTFRRLKHEFDSIGNIIEANRFYHKEMQKREEELKGTHWKEWIVFKIHDISSNHSQEWSLALYWIVAVTFIYSQIKIFSCQDNSELYAIPLILNIIVMTYIFLEINISKFLSVYNNILGIAVIYSIYGFITKDFTLYEFCNNINPFSIMTGDETLTFRVLIYKLTIAYLMYQFIISIRQNTRRK